jgi:TatD DNase family protein
VEYNKPVVIHTRDADEDTRSILAEFVSQMPKKGVIHSFTSGLALAEYCLSEGFCLGFNGICTFNKAENVREVITATPMEQVLLETDAPYLTPVPYRGRENAPCYLPFIAEKVAEVKGLEVETVLAQAYQNSLRELFS